MYEGMSLLDYFAAEAMKMVLQNEYRGLDGANSDRVAQYSYVMAESMMAERKRRSEVKRASNNNH